MFQLKFLLFRIYYIGQKWSKVKQLKNKNGLKLKKRKNLHNSSRELQKPANLGNMVAMQRKGLKIIPNIYLYGQRGYNIFDRSPETMPITIAISFIKPLITLFLVAIEAWNEEVYRRGRTQKP